MINAPKNSLLSAFNTGSNRYEHIEVQLEEKGMVFRSDYTNDGSMIGFGEGSYLCENCKGMRKIKCYNCQEQRLDKEIKFRFGDPPDCLCTFCYEKVSAKRWKELRKEILEEHRWDYD